MDSEPARNCFSVPCRAHNADPGPVVGFRTGAEPTSGSSSARARPGRGVDSYIRALRRRASSIVTAPLTLGWTLSFGR
eukprot:14401087-Alexandrium_andersonii.AAC.1